MTGLTTKQEAFAQACAAGVPQSTAYRNIYNPHENMAPRTLYAMASRLAHSDKVALRIEELKTEIADACLWSREQSVMVLAGIAGTGDSKVKPSEKTAAVKELNAMHGFNAPTKVGLEHSGVVKTILEQVITDERPDE